MASSVAIMHWEPTSGPGAVAGSGAVVLGPAARERPRSARVDGMALSEKAIRPALERARLGERRAFGELFGRQVAQGGYQFGTALATVHQAVMLVFNLALGLPAFLSVRRDIARIQAEIREDQEAEAQDEAASEAPPEPAPQSEADV